VLYGGVAVVQKFQLNIEQWSAWAPGLTTREQWSNWSAGTVAMGHDEVPPSDFLPPKLRRRLSSMNKTVLASVYGLGRDLSQLPAVFASRHGDMQTTVELFGLLAQKEALSPARFTRSTLNASQGLFSIAQKNHQPATAISAGASTFCYAMLEAAGQLSDGATPEVLVSMGDERLPACYRSFVDEPAERYSLALLVSGRSNSKSVRCRLTRCTDSYPTHPELPAALAFLRWLLGKDRRHEFAVDTHRWVWERI